MFPFMIHTHHQRPAAHYYWITTSDLLLQVSLMTSICLDTWTMQWDVCCSVSHLGHNIQRLSMIHQVTTMCTLGCGSVYVSCMWTLEYKLDGVICLPSV